MSKLPREDSYLFFHSRLHSCWLQFRDHHPLNRRECHRHRFKPIKLDSDKAVARMSLAEGKLNNALHAHLSYIRSYVFFFLDLFAVIKNHDCRSFHGRCRKMSPPAWPAVPKNRLATAQPKQNPTTIFANFYSSNRNRTKCHKWIMNHS